MTTVQDHRARLAARAAEILGQQGKAGSHTADDYMRAVGLAQTELGEEDKETPDAPESKSKLDLEMERRETVDRVARLLLLELGLPEGSYSEEEYRQALTRAYAMLGYTQGE
jgi:hypothetical protein